MADRRLNQTAPGSMRPIGGKVFVEKAAILDDIINDSNDASKSQKRYIRTQIIESPVAEEGLKGRPLTSAPEVDLKRSKKDGNPHAEALQKQKDRRERAFPVLLAGVDQAMAALDDIDREMNLQEEARRNKVRRQFEDWNSNVHGEIQVRHSTSFVIFKVLTTVCLFASFIIGLLCCICDTFLFPQKRIQSTIATTEGKHLNKRKNQDYQKFLDVTNRKPAIFRDIIIESEYDPLEPNRKCIVAKTGLLEDPVKISEIKAKKEASMLGTGPKSAITQKKALGKDTLDVELWASGKIESTPYGTFAKMMSNTSGQSQEKSKTMQSHIHFDHFSFPKGRAAIDAEMPKGKRVHPEPNVDNPNRIFGGLPDSFKQEVSRIAPPENRRPF